MAQTPYRLYSHNQVMLATLLGSPIAGGALASLNWRRLGKEKEARQWLAMGAGFTVLVVALALVLPESVPGTGIAIGSVVGMRHAALVGQGPAVAAHVAAGGKLAPWWHAILVGLAGMLVVLLPVAVVVAISG
jgi:hypothetical protein